MTAQLGWFLGLMASMCVALAGQAELVGELWRHYIAIAGVVATATTGYMLQHPPPKWDGIDRRKDTDR
jgi:hypothetical protein